MTGAYLNPVAESLSRLFPHSQAPVAPQVAPRHETSPSMSTNCPCCDRFARTRSRSEYDGTWNQTWITTYCKRCGEHTSTDV